MRKKEIRGFIVLRIALLLARFSRLLCNYYLTRLLTRLWSIISLFLVDNLARLWSTDCVSQEGPKSWGHLNGSKCPLCQPTSLCILWYDFQVRCPEIEVASSRASTVNSLWKVVATEKDKYQLGFGIVHFRRPCSCHDAILR